MTNTHMKDEIEKISHEGLTVNIYRDVDAMSPDEWGDDTVFLVGDNREFYVRPPGIKGRDWTVQGTVDQYSGTHHVFGLEAYIHSGVALHLSGECRIDRQWDVSQVGAVFVSKKDFRLRKSAVKAAEGVIDEWNQYLSGEVYGYVIMGPDGEGLGNMMDESCWGFYGLDCCIEEARNAAGLIANRIKAERERKLKALIRNNVPLDKRMGLINGK